MRQINPNTVQDDGHQPAVATNDDAADSTANPSPTGHEAQWAGEQKAFTRGRILGQVIRGVVSGAARSLTDHAIDLIISD